MLARNLAIKSGSLRCKGKCERVTLWCFWCYATAPPSCPPSQTQAIEDSAGAPTASWEISLSIDEVELLWCCRANPSSLRFGAVVFWCSSRNGMWPETLFYRQLLGTNVVFLMVGAMVVCRRFLRKLPKSGYFADVEIRIVAFYL